MNPNSWLNLLGLGTSGAAGKAMGMISVSSLLLGGALLSGVFDWLDGPTVVKNRQVFEVMDGRDKKELIRKWNRFQALPEAEQNRYRQFHQELNAHPDSKVLKPILNRYANWIVSIESTTRGRIREAELDEKISLIKNARIKQYLENAGKDEKTRLSLRDAEILRNWQEKLSIPDRGRWWEFEPDDLDALQTSLSPEPQQLMAQFATGNIGFSDDEERGDLRRRLVMNWIIRTQWVPPNDQQLEEIYANLSDEQKEELLDLNGDPMAIRRKLMDFYYRQVGVERRSRRSRSR